MALKLGMVAYPVVAVGMIAHKNAAVGPFADVNAYSPETARKPESLKVDYRALRRAVKSGVLLPVGDGRYYIDRRTHKKKLVRSTIVFGGIGVLIVGLVFLPGIMRMLG